MPGSKGKSMKLLKARIDGSALQLYSFSDPVHLSPQAIFQALQVPKVLWKIPSKPLAGRFRRVRVESYWLPLGPTRITILTSTAVTSKQPGRQTSKATVTKPAVLTETDDSMLKFARLHSDLLFKIWSSKLLSTRKHSTARMKKKKSISSEAYLYFYQANCDYSFTLGPNTWPVTRWQMLSITNYNGFTSYSLRNSL